MKIYVLSLAVLIAVTLVQPAHAEKRLFPPQGTCDSTKQAVVGWNSAEGLTCTSVLQSKTSDAVGVGVVPVEGTSLTVRSGLTVQGGNAYPKGGLVLPSFNGNPPSVVEGSIWIDSRVSP